MKTQKEHFPVKHTGSRFGQNQSFNLLHHHSFIEQVKPLREQSSTPHRGMQGSKQKKNPPKLKSRGTEKLIQRSSWWQTRGSPTERCFYSMWSSCGWCWWWLQQSVRPDLSPPPSLLSPPLSAGFPLRPPSRQLLAWPSGCCWIRRFGRLLEGLLPQWASACWSLGCTRSPVPGESEHESVGKVNGRARRKPVLNRKLAALVF